MVDIVLFLLAIIGGIISFLTPCNLVTLPTFLTYIGTQAKSTKNSIIISISFSVGFCLMYSIIATLFIIITGFISYTFWLKLFSGIIIICFSVYLFFSKQITRKTPIYDKVQNSNSKKNETSLNKSNKNSESSGSISLNYDEFKYKGYFGSFFLGFSLGSTWIGCITPIYVSILAVASNQESFLAGIVLFFLYALGIMIPYIIIGSTMGKIKQRFLVKLIKVGSKLQKIFALILLYLGIEFILSAFGIPGLLPFI